MAHVVRSTTKLLILLVASAVLLSSGCRRTEEAAEITPPVLPAIATWLNTHPEYGTAKSAENMPNWARGKRQQVRTTAGAYLFYLEAGDVVTVYRNDGSGRREVWRKPGQ
ncbi:MAG TPA: hypothetical protein VMY42_01275 [Thermoguttaceae bacterium]|nr:hypothetical protein [Thermoguttaceae bacterium]